ncbi:hypothetical protein J6590_063938 [Homalodisca vitripennis]|nr:hypothetical protein J6590_063938 [Homalodisca vitripennis]
MQEQGPWEGRSVCYHQPLPTPYLTPPIVAFPSSLLIPPTGNSSFREQEGRRRGFHTVLPLLHSGRNPKIWAATQLRGGSSWKSSSVLSKEFIISMD